mmetsp:Transcript_78523/g.220169  ORF Transcript_78523/g.220169 Transcript_78523/m.220169 type:complete len:91 (+) Transcript_78523:202-474(+)
MCLRTRMHARPQPRAHLQPTPSRHARQQASTTTIPTLSDEEREKFGKHLYKAAEKGDLDRARKYKQVHRSIHRRLLSLSGCKSNGRRSSA